MFQWFIYCSCATVKIEEVMGVTLSFSHISGFIAMKSVALD